MGYADMDWMDECINQVRNYEMLQKDDSNYAVRCRVLFARGYLSQCEGYGQVVELLEAILNPVEQSEQ